MCQSWDRGNKILEKLCNAKKNNKKKQLDPKLY